MNFVGKELEFETNLGKYTVTVFQDGRVIRNNRELHVADNGAGYLSVLVGYFKNSAGRQIGLRKYVHRLVAEAFIPNPEKLPQVNHKDFDKSNNNYDNLEWISKADNIQHSHDNGRMQKRYEVGPVNVLTKEEVIECYTRVIKNKEGVNVVAISMNKPRTTISSIVNKRSRKDITDKLDLDFSKDLDYTYYINEAKKLIEGVQNAK